MTSPFAPSRFLVAISLIAVFGLPYQLAGAHGSGELPPDSFIIRAEYALPDTGSFVNYEIPHVHPLDLNPSANLLAACNTPDGTVEMFAVDGSGDLTHSDTIRVGYAPVSARFRTDNELWVVNHLSDSISIVDISKGQIVDTIQTYDGYDGSHAGDEPADVIFTSTGVALVTGSRSDVIQEYDATTHAYNGEFRLDGEDPRMLAVNAAGTSVYAAIFESGNGSTIIRGDNGGSAGFPPRDAMTDTNNPYGGANPPFNNGIPGSAWVSDGASIVPADFTNAGTPQPPPVGLIVKKDGSGNWRDDNNANWDNWITGTDAAMSGRFTGWDLLDNDIAILTSGDSFASATYVTRQMNHVMAVAVNPADGEVFAVGTDATNEIRFEPNITGTFTRVMLSISNAAGTTQHLVDLNEEHLAAAQFAQDGVNDAYHDGSVPQAERDKSIGDPRGIAFKPGAGVAYITGMGSNNIIAVNTSDGSRFSTGHNLNLNPEAGATGIVHHPSADRLYVLNKFSASISVIDTTTVGSESVDAIVDFYDPTPAFINDGRVHLYDTHENSGLGQIGCASCHIDSRMDRLAWDLGNPAGGSPLGVEKFIDTSSLITGMAGENPDDVHNFLPLPGASNQDGQPFHTMKGPMTTQTLQDIIRHEPFHWRGDRDGLEEFAAAFVGLQGDDEPLSAFKMQEFEDFLSTVHFPPNPFRPLDNSLPGGPQIVGAGTNPNLPIPGHLSPGTSTGKGGFTAVGTQLPDGDAWQGFDDYMDAGLDGGLQCARCHALPMGSGPATTDAGQPIPPGAMGQEHIGMVSNDGTGQPHIKIPQTRNQFDKEGFFLNHGLNNADANPSRAGFGLVHDGIVDGLARFLAEPVFNTLNDQDLADIVAFSLCINGDGFDDLLALPNNIQNPSPDGGPVQTAHAAVGHQVTITSSAPAQADQDLIDLLVTLADMDKIGLIASGAPSGNRAGWYHTSGTGAGALFQPDDGGSTIALSSLQTFATSTNPLTFMAVPTVSDVRMGVDHDEDGAFNGSETDLNTDNGNPLDNIFVDGGFVGTPDGSPDAPFQTVNAGIVTVQGTSGKNAVVHIQAGDYNELGQMDNFLNTKTVLRAEGGAVRIGL